MKIKFFLKYYQKKQLKIIIGAGSAKQNNWISTEQEILNLLKEKKWNDFFQKESINAILAEHVWEHLTYNDGLLAAKNCYDYLKKDGHLRIAVPDGFCPDLEYINYVKPGGIGSGADDHKVLFNYKSMSALLNSAGFKVKLLEYYDENGNFISKNWNKKDGLIIRSKEYDPRNKKGNLKYTSLILDAIK